MSAALGRREEDISGQLSVPGEFRQILNICLDKDPAAENIETYIPTIRQIIACVPTVGQTDLAPHLRVAGRQRIHRSPCVDTINGHVQEPRKELEILRMEISGTYVMLGNKCNDAVAMFFTETDASSFTELMSTLEDLRAILEICFREEFVPEHAGTYLPVVRHFRSKLLKVLYDKRASLPGCVLPARARCRSVVSTGPVKCGIPVSTGRHIHTVKGNDRPKVKPRPPHTITQMDDEHQTEEDKD
ncbi:hypothetical protein ONZ45_g7770 [Pleurotus djamor]|nr:hypothetical protein ONZ45_g7770 [Pleurotus djamor]